MSTDPARADRHITGTGTDETTWRRWPGWARSPEPLDTLVPGRLVVVAPHPDDEVLGAGGLIRAVAGAGQPVVVVAVTPGDASHPGSARWPAPVLRVQRRFERANALARLGISDASTVELAVPDGQVGTRIESVATRLAELFEPGDTVVSPWRWDGHPDHEATTEAVIRAGRGSSNVRRLETPIWGWHWAGSEQFPEPAVLFQLDAEGRRAKERAISEYRSQLEPDPSTGAGPILPAWVLPRFRRDAEVYFRAG